MAVAIRGVVGQIKWAFYVAAAINGYTVTREAEQWTLRATVVSSDAFKLSKRPLLFVAPHAQGEWVWPIQSFQIESGLLRAALGAPEEYGESVYHGGTSSAVTH